MTAADSNSDTPVQAAGPSRGQLRVAIVHDWLPTIGGAERVLAELLRLFPQADVYTLVDLLSEPQRRSLGIHTVKTSPLQKSRLLRKRYRLLLPLLPYLIEQFDLEEYDVIISNNYAVAKGVIVHPHQFHLCHCCSPIRYAWDLQEQYLRENSWGRGLRGTLARMILHYIRLWDTRSANGVDNFVAISRFVARRIEKTYRRQSTVIYPPVDVEQFSISVEREDYYVTASRLVPYKRVDLIIAAFAGMPGRRLKIIGDGPELARLRQQAATSTNIEVLGRQSQEVLRETVRRARAFVFAAKEDFGISPVEAQAAGVPVIAYGAGAICETVIPGRTGVFFPRQDVPSLAAAIEAFEQSRFDPAEIRANALRFSPERFRAEFVQHFWREYESWQAK